MLGFDASPEREIPLARYQKQFLDVLWPSCCERRCFSDGELWKLWYTTMPSAEEMRAEIDRRPVLFQQGTVLSWAVRDLTSGKVVGMTTFMNIEAEKPRVEIGSTWYARSVQRTALNTECKLLLLTHAFDTLGCIAVEFRTSFFNFQGRRAIERLGAKPDGILCNHMRMPDGTIRDTCVYSSLLHEWTAVQENLLFKLGRT
ncbi:MAG: GNAT family N-acetyltransferase [Flavobacteriales bacterium]|nr:GNAT family N-acetyltransferase [Flavobacteriales bacterium]MBK9701656.1 GNAT family N-acetyltransferase [Flavobacteriales bacterium]